MIIVPTVLILGAGASVDYGFPVGVKLREEIIKKIPETTWFDVVSGIYAEKKAANRDVVVPDIRGRIKQFKAEFDESQQESIDLFLERRNDEVDTIIGKVAIAIVLNRKEKASNLNPDKIGWYKYLINKICPSDINNFASNILSVLTFNYDRSFEHFLFKAIKSTYKIKDDEAARLMEAIPIIHLHGSLGKLPFMMEYVDEKIDKLDFILPYGLNFEENQVSQASDHINIIHEDISNNKEFNQAHKILSEAKRIIFLGFGYNEVNLERLQIDFGKIDIELLGTCKGFSEQEIKHMKIMMNNNIEFGGKDHTVLEFLHDKDILHRELDMEVKKIAVKALELSKYVEDKGVNRNNLTSFINIIEGLSPEAVEVMLASYKLLKKNNNHLLDDRANPSDLTSKSVKTWIDDIIKNSSINHSGLVEKYMLELVGIKILVDPQITVNGNSFFKCWDGLSSLGVEICFCIDRYLMWDSKITLDTLLVGRN
jgi:hypothetical protein